MDQELAERIENQLPVAVFETFREGERQKFEESSYKGLCLRIEQELSVEAKDLSGADWQTQVLGWALQAAVGAAGQVVKRVMDMEHDHHCEIDDLNEQIMDLRAQVSRLQAEAEEDEA
jgi:hypothetical protein